MRDHRTSGRLLLAAVVLLILMPCLGMAGDGVFLMVRDTGTYRSANILFFVGPITGLALGVLVVFVLWVRSSRADSPSRTEEETPPDEDVEDTLVALLQQLSELNEPFRNWARSIERFRRSWEAKTDGARWDDVQKAVAEFTEKKRQTYDPCEVLYGLMDELCPVYLKASADQRARIRVAVGRKTLISDAIVLGYVYRTAKRIRSRKDREWLWWGLAALSIENCSTDYRDMLLALAELYMAAQNAWMRPMPAFRAVAALSSDQEPRGGSTSVQEILAHFDQYNVVFFERLDKLFKLPVVLFKWVVSFLKRLGSRLASRLGARGG